MKDLGVWDILPAALLVGLAAMWLSAGLAKMRSMRRFVASTTDLVAPLPASLAAIAARLVPSLEVMLAGALLIQPATSAAALASTVLLALFVIVLIRARVLGMAVPCNCFGSSTQESEITAWTVARTVALFVASLLAWVSRPDSRILYSGGVAAVGVLTFAALFAAAALLCSTLASLRWEVEPRLRGARSATT